MTLVWLFEILWLSEFVSLFLCLFFKQVLYRLFIQNTNPTLDTLNLSGALQTRDVSVSEDHKAQSPPRDTNKQALSRWHGMLL